MADLREKILARKLSSSCLEQVDVSVQKQEEGRPSGSTDDHQELVERRGFRTPVQEAVDRDRSWGRSTEKKRRFGAIESPHGRSKYTPVRDQYPVGDRNHRVAFSPRLRFPISDNDIDIRYDPEFDFGHNMRFGASFTDVRSKEIDHESCDKMYKMAKELKSQQEKIKMIQDENQNLRRKLSTADDLVFDAQKKLETKEEDLNHVEVEMHSMRRKIESDEVLIKDFVFENRNKRELIVSLEQEIKELKKTKFKLLGENAQIRKLAKEISDDSDNLLKVINDLKAEKKVADEKIIDLLESLEGEKDQLDKTSKDVDEDDSKSDDALQEEVNQNHANPEEEATLDNK